MLGPMEPLCSREEKHELKNTITHLLVVVGSVVLESPRKAGQVKMRS